MLFRITEVLRATLGIWYRVAVRIGLLAGALYNGCMNGTHTVSDGGCVRPVGMFHNERTRRSRRTRTRRGNATEGPETEYAVSSRIRIG